MPIFRSRTPPRTPPDPLLTPKSAAAWFRELPTVDTIGRQQVVMHAIERLCQPGSGLELDQVAVIEFLDGELAADRGRLITQYVEHAERSPALANRIWQAAYEISQGFIVAYRALAERALARGDDARWKGALPRLVARLIHFYGTDAKLRVLKNEPWIPAKWVELNSLYRRALELGIARAAVGTDTAGSAAGRPTIEQEYLAVLLTHLLNTGTLVPGEIDWAAAQVRVWTAGLALDDVPRTSRGFVVDVAGRAGLVRRTGTETGALLRFLDTTPLTLQLDRALDALRRLAASEPEGAALANRQRIGILEKLRPAVCSEAPAAVPREPRSVVSLAAQVRLGFTQICHELAPSELRNAAIEAGLEGEGGELVTGAERTRAGIRAGPLDTGYSERLWRVDNRSATGLRIVGTAGLGQGLALGTLVAVREADGAWILGVVRRVTRPTTERVEVGVAIIASRVHAVALHAKRQAREDMGFVVDGVDVSTIGERFDGLYVPPPSRPGQPLAAKSLVVPTSEYGEGRRIILITTRTVYTVALGEALERHPDWTWAVIDVVGRAARD